MRHSGRRFRLLAGTALLALIGLPAAGAPVPREPPGRAVRLGDIVTNSYQPNLRYPKLPLRTPAYDDLRAVRKAFGGWDVSNLFLARGADFRAALKDTRETLTRDAGAETPAERKAREASRTTWLVVFLGGGPSEPPQWTVESAKVVGRRVVVSYSTIPPGGIESRDRRCYVYWVPLGDLPDGRYIPELVDHKTGEVLMRRHLLDDGRP